MCCPGHEDRAVAGAHAQQQQWRLGSSRFKRGASKQCYSGTLLCLCTAPHCLKGLQFPAVAGPSGLLVANDLDKGRSYMLAHLCRKIGNTSLCVINEDATKLTPQAFSGLRTLAPKDDKEGVFDRILADLPCGGDGTFRKAVGPFVIAVLGMECEQH